MERAGVRPQSFIPVMDALYFGNMLDDFLSVPKPILGALPAFISALIAFVFLQSM